MAFARDSEIRCKEDGSVSQENSESGPEIGVTNCVRDASQQPRDEDSSWEK